MIEENYETYKETYFHIFPASNEELLVHYENLYQNRFYVDAELKALIEHGYYGEIIRGK